MTKICSAFSSSHTTQEEITLGIFKHSCKLPNIIKVASVTARLKWFELFGFFKELLSRHYFKDVGYTAAFGCAALEFFKLFLNGLLP